MSGAEVFFDTNVVLYLLSGDAVKADRAEELLAIGGMISVQVLNEFAAVASRKLRMGWKDIGAQVAERYGLPIYDALIVAAALLAGCTTLYSEDLQGGQVIERQLTIRNPF